jgi:hypothetical protein
VAADVAQREADLAARKSPPGPGPEPEPEPETEGRDESPPTLRLGEINRRLGFSLPASFVEGTLGIPRAGTAGQAVLFRESQWPPLKAALVRHVQASA